MVQSRSIQKTCVAVAVAQAISFNVSEAATFRVTNGFDEGIGCTMRDALENINNGVSAPTNGCLNQTGEPAGTNDTIELGVSTVSSLTATLEITDDVAINPSGGLVTFLGNGNDRVFDINFATVTMNSVTVRNGVADDGDPDTTTAEDDGGGILMLGSNLTLQDSQVTANRTSGSGGGIRGFGGTLTLLNSSITDNTAALGGGLAATGSVVNLTQGTVARNTATQEGGGGVFLEQFGRFTASQSQIVDNVGLGSAETTGGGFFVSDLSAVNLKDTTLSGNTANVGGGIYIDGYSSVTLGSSTAFGNSARGRGGAAFVNFGELRVTNSTISGNESQQRGSAIFAQPDDLQEASNVFLNHATISGNIVVDASGALRFEAGSRLQIGNTILSGNVGGGPFYQEASIDGDATVINLGNNLLGDSSNTINSAFSGFNFNPSDIIATSDRSLPTALSDILGPLADNGGLTLTHALAAGSPAIDAGDNANCPATDQRGEARDLQCDIGAYERIDDTNFFVVPLPNGKAVIFGL